MHLSCHAVRWYWHRRASAHCQVSRFFTLPQERIQRYIGESSPTARSKCCMEKAEMHTPQSGRLAYNGPISESAMNWSTMPIQTMEFSGCLIYGSQGWAAESGAGSHSVSHAWNLCMASIILTHCCFLEEVNSLSWLNSHGLKTSNKITVIQWS